LLNEHNGAHVKTSRADSKSRPDVSLSYTYMNTEEELIEDLQVKSRRRKWLLALALTINIALDAWMCSI